MSEEAAEDDALDAGEPFIKRLFTSNFGLELGTEEVEAA